MGAFQGNENPITLPLYRGEGTGSCRQFLRKNKCFLGEMNEPKE
jgi:hypothetical protein